MDKKVLKKIGPFGVFNHWIVNETEKDYYKDQNKRKNSLDDFRRKKEIRRRVKHRRSEEEETEEEFNRIQKRLSDAGSKAEKIS